MIDRMLRSLALASLALPALAQAATWTVYKGDGFTVELPAKPQIQSQTFSAEGVSGTSTNAIAPTAAYACVASGTQLSRDVPPAVLKNLSDGIKKGFLNSVGGVATADKAASDLALGAGADGPRAVASHKQGIGDASASAEHDHRMHSGLGR